MKLIRTRTSLALAALLALTLVGMRPRADSPPEHKSYTGTVTAWSIVADGTVALRLEGQAEDKTLFKLWFATAANRTTTTNFEDLILEAVLAMRREGNSSVTVVADESNDHTGKTDATAITLVGLRGDM